MWLYVLIIIIIISGTATAFPETTQPSIYGTNGDSDFVARMIKYTCSVQ
jgi:hypothetical protein